MGAILRKVKGTMSKQTALQVEAQNAIAKLHNSLRHTLAEAAQRLIADNVKISTAQGTLTQAARKRLPELPAWSGYSVGMFDLVANLKVCVLDGTGGCVYKEAAVYMVEDCGQHASKDPHSYGLREAMRDDWTVEEVLRLRKEAEEAEAAAREALAKLTHFGRY